MTKDTCLKCKGDGRLEGYKKCSPCNGDGWIDPAQLPDMTHIEALEMVLEIIADGWARLRDRGDSHIEGCHALGRLEDFCNNHLERHREQAPIDRERGTDHTIG